MEQIASRLSGAEADKARALAARSELTAKEAQELARLLLPIYQPEDATEEPASDKPLDANGLVNIWREVGDEDETADAGGDFGLEPDDDDEEGPVGGREPKAAFDVGAAIFKVRDLLRATTVLMMKDRAGVVGAHGVGGLLREILAMNVDPEPRVHLIGHSFGCKVALSALCYLKLPRKVNSVLLLQAAIGRFCFASDVTKDHKPGGYHAAPERSEQPIMTTFSCHDKALTKYFHLIVHRQDDEGEIRIAAWLPGARFKALGGYGPAGCDAETHGMDILEPTTAYDIAGETKRILALKADKTISGHSDISNESTWWALFNQVNQP